MILFEDKLIKIYDESNKKDDESLKLKRLLRKYLDILYNPNNFLTILNENKEYKIFFITINYDNNIDNITANLEKSIRFFAYSICDFVFFNNEYYTKNKKNHYHNHILLFTRNNIYKSLLIQRIERCTDLEKNFIDVKQIKRNIRKNVPNGTFKKEIQNKIKYILGLKTPTKQEFVNKDIELFNKLEIKHSQIYFNSNILYDSFTIYKNEIYNYFKTNKLYSETYNLLSKSNL